MSQETITVKCADNKYTKKHINQMGETSMLITKKMFDKYRKVQYGGAYNMMMEWEIAQDATSLTPLVYWTIIKNYNKLQKHFGDYNEN